MYVCIHVQPISDSVALNLEIIPEKHSNYYQAYQDSTGIYRTNRKSHGQNSGFFEK